MEPYVVQGSTLVVNEPHLVREDTRFDKACSQLLNQPGPVYTLDLSAVRVITSTYVGIVAVMYLDANKAGKKILVKAGKRVLDVFRLAGFEGKIDMVEAPGQSVK